MQRTGDSPAAAPDRMADEQRSATAMLVNDYRCWTAASLPDEIIEHTHLVLLDTLGAMIAASSPSFAGIAKLEKFASLIGAEGPFQVVGTSFKCDAPHAALINGYLAYAMDIETHHGPSVVHAAAAVVPAALAAGQISSASGAELLASIALGIEVACRASAAIGPNDLYHRGFHPTSVGGAFGAAAAASYLLKLDGDQFELALGLAATQACGLLAWASDETEESRPFNPGLAARNGLAAAQLAALGFGAPLGVFSREAKYNVFRTWSLDEHGRPDLLALRPNGHYAVSELIFKKHACCAFLHPSLDGLLSIIGDASLAAEEIDEITAFFPRSGAPIIDNNPLRSHRAQYILPLATIRRQVRFDDVIEDRSSDPQLQRIASRTKLIHDDDLDRFYPERYTSRVCVTTNTGMTYERVVEFAHGTPENPVSGDEIRSKFFQLTAQRLSPERAESVVAAVKTLKSATGLTQVLNVIALPD